MIEKRPLGHTGIDVTSICLGTMTFGSQTDEAAPRAPDAAADFAPLSFMVPTQGEIDEMTEGG